MNQACLPTQTAEQQLYKYQMNLALTLYANGDNWMDIDSATRDTLAAMVQYDSRNGYMAGSISALVGTAPVTWPIPLFDTGLVDSVVTQISPRPGRNNSPISENASTMHPTFLLFPNPTNGGFTISAGTAGTFVLMNAVGQKLLEQKISEGKNELIMPDKIQRKR